MSVSSKAYLISSTRKYDRGLSQILHADLHWFDVADRLCYKLAVTVHRCQHNKAPKYLTLTGASLSATSPVIRDCAQHIVTTSSTQYTLGHRAFSVAGPIVWNSLPDELRDDTEDSNVVLGSH